MKNQTETNKEFIHIDFDKFWRFVPANRPLKEQFKWTLFSSFPFVFKKFEVFQNWKNARIFEDNSIRCWNYDFWKRKLFYRYDIKFQINENHCPEKENEFSKLAVVVHAFYPEVLQGILSKLQESNPITFKLFVTTSESTIDAVEEILVKSKFEYFLKTVDNRGRDVLPFLKILKYVFDEGYTLVLKLHTKRSNHLNKKDVWSDDLFRKLLGYENMINIVQTFHQHEKLGMIGPSEHILPMSFYYGGNAAKVEMLGKKMGLQNGQFSNLHFPAGTMFYARKEALLPILNLNLHEADFEDEAGQLDCTMAHAVERAFACSVIAAGMYLADSSSKPDMIRCKINLNHSFTL